MLHPREVLLTTALLLVPSLFAQRTIKPITDVARTAEKAPSEATPATDPAGITWQGKMMLDESRQDLPYIHESMPLGKTCTGFTAYLSDVRYAPISSKDVNALPGLGSPGPEPQIRSIMGIARKHPLALVDIYPYRRNSATGQLERLLDYRLQLVEEHHAGGAGRPKSATYPDHSKMASGEWYRFTVPEDGVYKLTYPFLQQLGLNTDGLSSDRINIYGNHAGPLPFTNSPPLPNDLLVNTIEVADGGDGQFGPNDYILFYATGPHRWNLNNTTGLFEHTKNTCSDSASYFVALDVEPASRIADATLSSAPATDQVTAFDDRQFIDRDLLNFLKSGRTWFAETYDQTTTYNYSFNVPFPTAGDTAVVRFDVAARTLETTNYSSFTFSAAGISADLSIQGVSPNYTGQYAKPATLTLRVPLSGSVLPITVTFNKHDPISSLGWMNFMEVNARRDLKMVGDQLGFRDLRSVGPDRISEFTLDLASGIQRIWEITDPTHVGNVAFADNGAQKVFRVTTDSLRQFIAFKNTGFLVPTPVGHVPNQDLHATPLPTDLVIVCPSEFQGEAQRLAEHRAEEGLTVVMVTPQQIFNEFSSGQRDVTAIKRYMKMLYDRAGSDEQLMPRYLLLFGDGSYNNINLAPSNQNLIPSYQSFDSWIPASCFTSDDYFGLLDDSEGEANPDVVDIGIGRLPVSDATQARDAVNKLLNYDKLMIQSNTGTSCTSGSDGGASDWRNWVLFASDDQSGDGFDGTTHMANSDALASQVESLSPCLNINKIYLDAYVQQSTPGGQRYPEAQAALRDRVQKGLLLVNYVGHGGEVGWAHERFLDVQTILDWTNLDRLPLFMTATCEFSRWDDPARTSAGELVFLNPNGGGIGLMTTTRIAYSGANQTLATEFFNHVFSPTEELGRDQRFGDAYRRTKAGIAGSTTNYRNFTLLGDPSTRLALARNAARITAITDTLGNPVDTIQALATVRISGEVTDTLGQILSDFSGVVVPTVFDKKVTVSTLANDGGSPYNFGLRKNIIYRGKVSVTNGLFHFTFVVPKDINYQVGAGRISIYAENLQTNACGYTNDPLIGGSDPNAISDAVGPEINLFMNDERFVPGGTTNETPLLYAKFFDQNGINTLGNSIGHDLTAVVDASNENAIVLNDVYEADLDTYKSGKVRYRLTGLGEGSHTLTMKAWDVFNNSSQKSLDFVVAPSAQLALEHVLNYPNPFTTHTDFYFEHNRPCGNLNVQVQVFTVAGRLVKTLDRELACDGFRSEPLAWDGLDDNGDKLGRGVYVYRLRVANDDGEAADKVEKLVILR